MDIEGATPLKLVSSIDGMNPKEPSTLNFFFRKEKILYSSTNGDGPLLEMNGLDEFKSFLRRILDHKFCFQIDCSLLWYDKLLGDWFFIGISFSTSSLTKLNITSIVSNFPIPRDRNNVVSSQNHMDSSIKIQNNTEQWKIRFIDNIDPTGIDHQITQLGPELDLTLVIVISKVNQGINVYGNKWSTDQHAKMPVIEFE
ncbi:hypothetical protein H5410_021254 [Solanum commersonii]|uniref:Uncharacterized protein n=1 Tax=Solanum commersonii TaxID=4109 RepID=A0A9J5ZC40_SOLCO|nr:hypothetical protein H5410_021254 [Solanum commersonii]